jgi:hypothetical protein
VVEHDLILFRGLSLTTSAGCAGRQKHAKRKHAEPAKPRREKREKQQSERLGPKRQGSCIQHVSLRAWLRARKFIRSSSARRVGWSRTCDRRRRDYHGEDEVTYGLRSPAPSKRMVTSGAQTSRPLATCWRARCAGGAPVYRASEPRARRSAVGGDAHADVLVGHPCGPLAILLYATQTGLESSKRRRPDVTRR